MKNIKIRVGKINGYPRVINLHYNENNCAIPYDSTSGSKTSNSLNDQKRYEDAPSRLNTLSDKALVYMCRLGQEHLI